MRRQRRPCVSRLARRLTVRYGFADCLVFTLLPARSNYVIPGKLMKGMGGAMDLVSSPEHTKVVVLTDHVDKVSRWLRASRSGAATHPLLPLSHPRRTAAPRLWSTRSCR